jgi:glycosyltransferase involved in cell wall biosynthesis
VVQGLASGLARRGHEVSVVAVVDDPARAELLFAPLRDTPCLTLTLDLPARGYVREIGAVRRLLRERRPSVLHTHGYRPDLLHGRSARGLGVASVSTLHGSSRMGGLSRLFEWAQEYELSRFDAVIAVSPPLTESLERKGVPSDRIHLIPNAWQPAESPLTRVEARTALGIPVDARNVIGWVGRLIPVKGPDVFLRALQRLASEDWTAWVVGAGPEGPGLETLARELGVESRIRFLGSVADAGRYFSAFDLFALSSRSEGTPVVLLEAMSAGAAIVATRVGGVPHMLKDGAEAWLVPPENPEAFAAAVESGIGNPTEALTRSNRAKTRLQGSFDPGVWIDRHEATYRTALEVRRGRR